MNSVLLKHGWMGTRRRPDVTPSEPSPPRSPGAGIRSLPLGADGGWSARLAISGRVRTGTLSIALADSCLVVPPPGPSTTKKLNCTTRSAKMLITDSELRRPTDLSQITFHGCSSARSVRVAVPTPVARESPRGAKVSPALCPAAQRAEPSPGQSGFTRFPPGRLPSGSRRLSRHFWKIW